MEPLGKEEIKCYGERLIDAGLRPSETRVMLMAYLDKYRSHPTADEMWAALKDYLPTLSRTTVYNTMNAFEERGLVQQITLDPEQARWDIDTSAHGHFLCRKCGKVSDVWFGPHGFEMPTYLVPKGFVTEHAEVHFSGVCGTCVEAEKAKASATEHAVAEVEAVG